MSLELYPTWILIVSGFPDSYVLWRKLLTSPALSSYILIAVDLPGYGGSDSLEQYDPDHVLETMTWFILGMRQLYLSEGAKLIMVTHDWGTLVGSRLASEAKELADRWILTAGVIVSFPSPILKTHLTAPSLSIFAPVRKLSLLPPGRCSTPLHMI